MAETTDPDDLEARIARTRSELAHTVDSIADRVSPKRVAERSVANVKDRATTFVASVGDALGVRSKPVGLAGDPDRLWDDEQPKIAPVLIGVGAVLVVGAAITLLRRRKRS